MGIFVQQHSERNPAFVEKYGSWTVEVVLWLSGLMFWIYALNLGIGLFNLVPLGPIDGGRMFKTALERFLPKAKAYFIWKWTGLGFLALIIINIAFAFIR